MAAMRRRKGQLPWGQNQLCRQEQLQARQLRQRNGRRWQQQQRAKRCNHQRQGPRRLRRRRRCQPHPAPSTGCRESLSCCRPAEQLCSGWWSRGLSGCWSRLRLGMRTPRQSGKGRLPGKDRMQRCWRAWARASVACATPALWRAAPRRWSRRCCTPPRWPTRAAAGAGVAARLAPLLPRPFAGSGAVSVCAAVPVAFRSLFAAAPCRGSRLPSMLFALPFPLISPARFYIDACGFDHPRLWGSTGGPRTDILPYFKPLLAA